jgi:hypothetical protein
MTTSNERRMKIQEALQICIFYALVSGAGVGVPRIFLGMLEEEPFPPTPLPIVYTLPILLVLTGWLRGGCLAYTLIPSLLTRMKA